jgi:chromosome segregation ATPase
MARVATSSGSRTPGATRPPREVAPPEIRPSQIHDLKLQTQKIQQQTTVLRTQLKRTQDQISSKTSAINKTFELSADKAATPATIHANTIPNLQRNVEGARNALEILKEQIAETECDDRTVAVEELEEEVKVTYCEFRRLTQGLQDKRAAIAVYARELQDAEFRASTKHQNDLKAALRDIRYENAVLRDKANAYQLKIEKLVIETKISEAHKADDVINQAEVERAELNQSIAKTRSQLDKQEQRHRANVDELMDILTSLRQKIDARLNE